MSQSLSAQLRADFPPDVRSRGERYFHAGRVQIVESALPGAVSARVRGSAMYDVLIEHDEDGLIDYSCTCPYFIDIGACKHVWATVLAAEAGEYGGLKRWAVSLRSLAAEMSLESPHAGRDGSRAQGEQRLVYIVDAPASQYRQQGLVIEVALQGRKQNGEWKAPRSTGVGGASWDMLADDADAEIGQMLRGAHASRYAGYYASTESRFALEASMVPLVLERMCETGRCQLRVDADNRHIHALVWDAGTPWEFVLTVTGDASDSIRVDGWVVRDDERVPISAPQMLLPGGLTINDGIVNRIIDHGATNFAALLRREGPLTVPAGEVPQLIEELHALPRLPRIEWAPSTGVVEIRQKPAPSLRLKPAPYRASGPDRLQGVLSFAYSDGLIAAEEPTATVVMPGKRVIVYRDRAAESAAAATLDAVGFRLEHDYETGHKVPVLAISKLDAALDALTVAGWHVEMDGPQFRAAGARDVAIRSGIDWFDLEGGVAFGTERAELPALLAALRRGEHAVRLGDGSLGVLPLEWLRRVAAVAEMGAGGDGHGVRLARTQVGLLDALLSAMPEITSDALFTRARDELRSFERVAAIDAPPGFRGELRGYQREGLGWLEFLRRFGFGGCLADDMGLGKTVQLLALLEMRRGANGTGPSLVVVPRSLIFNWHAEAGRFTPALRVLDHSGIMRQRDTGDFANYDMILTTYGTLRRDIAMLRSMTFDYVVLDEAQAIKNPGSASAKAARLLSARHRLALTGTPVENRLGDLRSLFDFLNPGMLGPAAAFKRLYEKAETGRDAESNGASRAMLASALRPFLLRRTKEQVARDLPRKQEQTVLLDLGPTERKLYNELRDHYRAALLGRIAQHGVARSKMHILEALLRLRQAACHPGLIDKTRTGDTSSKLELLSTLISEVVESGHKALVFSQFTSLLAIVRAQLDAQSVVYEYLDGKTRKRAEAVTRFQDDASCKVFLISLKAGGLGLNLTAADYVFLLDPWWNPAVEAQAVDRAHRIGQTRRVLASRLIARDTVEERVLELQQRKRALADAIIGEDNSVVSRIGRAELELLLS